MEIQRENYLQKLIDRMDNGLIKVITGVRRCGKSYLLFQLFRKYLLQNGVDETCIITIAFDRWDSRAFRKPDTLLRHLRELIEPGQHYYLLMDEVQMLEHFEEVLNELLHDENLDIYVTGSNSRFLSKDVITEFRGRGDEIHIFPLSFSEFMGVYTGDIYHGWAEYMMYGGLPLATLMKTDELKTKYLLRLSTETYLKDIIERNRIERQQELEDLLSVLASSVGALTNPSKILATFQSVLHSKLSLSAIRDYIGYFEDAFLIHPAKRYDVKGRKYIGTPLKYYFEDVGIRNAQLGFRQTEETHLMENILYNELRLRGFNVDVGMVNKRRLDPATGRRLSSQLEIDFVAHLGSRRYYIQSALTLPDEAKRQQEKASLLALSDSFKKIIIVKDIIKPQYDEDGILFVNLFDFLLHPESIEI